jgi:hypothetical protein
MGTAASGLVANALVPWPAGLATWRWLHLGMAVASAVVFLGLAAVRLRRSVAAPPPARTLGAALALAAMLGVTGWIGGEVLVFHAGMAVTAAAHGALAPTVSRAGARPRTSTRRWASSAERGRRRAPRTA